MKANYYTVKAVIRKDKIRTDGKCPIYIYLQRCGTTQKLSLGEVIFETDWDKTYERGKGKGFGTLNGLISKRKQDLEDFIRTNKTDGKDLNSQEISNFWNGKTNKELDFYSFFDTFCIRHLRDKKEGTRIHYTTLRKKLKAFRPVLKTTDIDYNFMQDFKTYLINTKSGRYNMIKFFKTALKEMEKLKLTKDDSWKNIKNETDDSTKTRFLTPKEIGLIVSCDLSLHRHLELTRNMFLFSCYTGLRFSDVASFKKEHYKNGIIKLKQTKTGVIVEVPVNTPAKKIICKYFANKNEEDYIFPRIDNQTINRYLKKLDTLCGIGKELHFHMARHTYGTTLLNSDVNVFYISKLMGHKKLSQTFSYTGIGVGKMKDVIKSVNFATNP